MKSAAENLSPTRVKLAIEVPNEELKPFLDAAYASIGQQVQVPGFRRGKVPARIIDQRVGRGAVVQEAVNEALPQLFGQAVEENNLRPLGQPEVDITEVPLEGEQQLKFTVEVDVRPEIVLPDLDGIEVEVEPLKVEDSDVEERMTQLRERFGSLKTVERAAAEGDFVTIDLSATIGDEKIDEVTGISYQVGEGNMLEGMDEAITGLSAGETKEFTAPLAGGDREGQDAECVVTVQSVKERELPELDDEFAQLASEFDTLAELQADVAAQTEQAKKFEQGIAARDRLLEILLEKVDFPVPDSIVEAEVTQHLEGENRLEDDEHRAEVEESTRKALRAQFLLDTILEQEEIQVEQGELIEYLIMTSQQYGMDPNQFAQMVDQQGQIPAIMGEVGRRKALASVLDRAVIKDTSGTVIDINDLVPGAQEGEEGDEETGTTQVQAEAPAEQDDTATSEQDEDA